MKSFYRKNTKNRRKNQNNIRR